ncbi:spore germination protein [Haloplasma contractile]
MFKNNKERTNSKIDCFQVDEKKHYEDQCISNSLQDNLTFIKKTLGNSEDIVIRTFNVGTNESNKMSLVYIDGLVDRNLVDNAILKTIMVQIRSAELDLSILNSKNIFQLLEENSLSASSFVEITNYAMFFNLLFTGSTMMLIDGFTVCIAVDTKEWDRRTPDEPTTQTVVRGPKESFTETIRTNTALIRRRLKDPSLRIDTKRIGTRSMTDVAIAYIKGVADDDVVNEVHSRLDKIKIDGILEGGYIEELIQDTAWTLFPTIHNTERPDTACASLLEGRVLIMVDGTPFVLVVPAIFVQFFQSAEDYYQRADFGTFSRLLRYVAFVLTLLTPATYIAVTSFHHELLPPSLLISIAAQREGIPFPAFIEALLMELTFEILREAGLRMPRAVGSAMSIVGALVLGDAAVNAGIISPVMVIVVSITAISSLISPTYNMAIANRLLRFGFMLLGATFGLYGIGLGLIAFVSHLTSLRSFGVPYMSPLAPLNVSGLNDTFIRSNIWKMFKRPALIVNKLNIVRQQKPSSKRPTTSNDKNQDTD